MLAEGTTGRSAEQSVPIANISAAVRAAGSRLESCLAAGRPMGVISPVNLSALSTDSVAGEYSSVCHAISDEARALLTVELVDLAKAPSLDLTDHAAIILFPFCGRRLAPEPLPVHLMQRRHLGVAGGRRFGHVGGRLQLPAGVFDHLVRRVAGMYTR